MFLQKDGSFTFNNDDRAEWVNNDEYLYQWWNHSGLSMGEFIYRYRKDIDKHINSALVKEPS